MSKEKLIIALDVPSVREAEAIISDIGDMVGAFKIGLQLFTAAGPSFVKKVAGRGHKIFLDLKFYDIPHTVAMAGIEAARLGVWMFNIHSLGGSEMIKRTVGDVEAACKRGNLIRPLIIGVTVLTSADRNTLEEVGINSKIEDEVLNLALLAAKCGLDGVVASPLECRALRKAGLGSSFLTVTPGIRPHAATNDDQKRVTTPAAAINAGASYLVIGRPITQAANRREAVDNVLKEIKKGC